MWQWDEMWKSLLYGARGFACLLARKQKDRDQSEKRAMLVRLQLSPANIVQGIDLGAHEVPALSWYCLNKLQKQIRKQSISD
jgi:hypothetical protein